MTEFAQVDGVKTAYTMSGVGTPLLLIHGAEASRHMFDLITPLLAQRFTVISYDQRDCGETEAPNSPPDLQLLADDAIALLRALGLPRAHIFGSSFGGRVAQAIALRAPAVVDHLILGSTWALSRTLAEANPQGSRRMAELRARLPGASAQLAAMFFPENYLAQNPHLLDIFANVQPTSERAARRALAVADRMEATLSAVDAKTLLLAGDADRVVPPALTFALAAEIGSCWKLLLKGVGHATCLQAPAEVARAVTCFIDDRLPHQGFDTP